MRKDKEPQIKPQKAIEKTQIKPQIAAEKSQTTAQIPIDYSKRTFLVILVLIGINLVIVFNSYRTNQLIQNVNGKIYILKDSYNDLKRDFLQFSEPFNEQKGQNSKKGQKSKILSGTNIDHRVLINSMKKVIRQIIKSEINNNETLMFTMLMRNRQRIQKQFLQINTIVKYINKTIQTQLKNKIIQTHSISNETLTKINEKLIPFEIKQFKQLNTKVVQILNKSPQSSQQGIQVLIGKVSKLFKEQIQMFQQREKLYNSQQKKQILQKIQDLLNKQSIENQIYLREKLLSINKDGSLQKEQNEQKVIRYQDFQMQKQKQRQSEQSDNLKTKLSNKLPNNERKCNQNNTNCTIESIYQTGSLIEYLQIKPKQPQTISLNMNKLFSSFSQSDNIRERMPVSQFIQKMPVSQFISLIKNSKDHLKEFQQVIQDNNIKLSQILLAHNQLQEKQLNILMDLFKHVKIPNQNIYHLDLSHNHLNTINGLILNDHQFIFLSLVQLKLNHNPQFNFQQFKKLTNIKLNNIQKLYLSTTSLTLKRNKKDINGQQITQQQHTEYQQIVKNIKKNWPSFQQLIVSNSELYQHNQLQSQPNINYSIKNYLSQIAWSTQYQQVNKENQQTPQVKRKTKLEKNKQTAEIKQKNKEKLKSLVNKEQQHKFVVVFI